MSELKKVFLENDDEIEFKPFRQNRDYGFTLQKYSNDKLTSTVHYKVAVVCIQSYTNVFLL